MISVIASSGGRYGVKLYNATNAINAHLEEING